MLNNLFKVGWKLKKWWHHLLYDDIINFLLTRKCQKTRKIEVLILNEKISLSSKQVEILEWNFQERHDLKVIKKQGFTLSLEYTNLEQVITTVKIWSERTSPRFLIFLFWVQGKVFVSVFVWILSYNNCQNLK